MPSKPLLSPFDLSHVFEAIAENFKFDDLPSYVLERYSGHGEADAIQERLPAHEPADSATLPPAGTEGARVF
ncbi:hypothetical protein CPB97_000324 [Podila verticillata]|nr:hypothetical protein CPB97_000324 [Podila verticillata]